MIQEKFSDLKEYTCYLIEQYKKINNSYQDSRIYWQLNQFSEEEKIKGLIEKSDNSIFKIEILNSFSKKIANFSKEWNIF